MAVSAVDNNGLPPAFHPCAACKNPLAEKVYKTACNHFFHLSCAATWAVQKPTCALCRAPVQILSPFKEDQLPKDVDAKCSICFDFLTTSLKDPEGDILIAKDGKNYHEACFQGDKDSDIQARIAAKDLIIDYRIIDYRIIQQPAAPFIANVDFWYEIALPIFINLLFALSALAFFWNAFLGFSDPTLWLCSIPFLEILILFPLFYIIDHCC